MAVAWSNSGDFCSPVPRHAYPVSFLLLTTMAHSDDPTMTTNNKHLSLQYLYLAFPPLVSKQPVAAKAL